MFFQKGILTVAVFFHIMLKKVSTTINRDLIGVTQKFKLFTGIKSRIL